MPAPPSITTVEFEALIKVCDLDDIQVPRFFDNVASTQERKNLKLLWDRAFEAGRKFGRNEDQVYRDEVARDKKAQGIKRVEEAVSRAKTEYYHHGVEKGRTEERSKWTSKNHGLRCFSPVAILSDQGSQTDPEPTTTSISTQTSTVSHLETSIQASEPPPSPSQPQKVISKPFDWADDTYSPPIIPLPTQNLTSPLLPRDFSGLCSSNLLDISGHRYLT
jgi:hypothetical protein